MKSNEEHDDFDEGATMVMPANSSGDATLSVAAPTLLAGRYQVLALVGRGGMGSVYRALDTELDEIIALKVLSDELANAPGLLERFRREVKLARRVTHPNVARMFDIGEDAGNKFLTMEFVDGESLGDLLARGNMLPVPRLLDIMGALCAGLSAAHKVGVVHRDLKPDNVMLARDGRVLITDFGIARDPVSAADGATLGMVVGTPAYMAPEQVEARPDIDSRADLYALGVMLFELLTGEQPWQGNSAFTLAAARLYAPPPDPRERRAQVSPALASVALRCMARAPADRFASADEVATALTAASPTLPQHAPVPSLPLPGPAIREKAVAVLPFRNLGASEEDYVAEGITEDLIDTLSMTEGLRVRPRGAVMRYRNTDRDPRELGRELGVEVVVEGSVRKAPSMVRLSARLISVEDGFQLWAKRFDRPATDLLVVSDETARAIADALTLSGGGRNRVAPSDPVAVDLYLRARAEIRQMWPENVLRAVELFKAANERAPNDPSILAGYARATARLWFYSPAGTEHAAEEARALAERAIATAPEDSEALLALGYVRLMGGDIVGAAALARSALDRAPDSVDAQELVGRLLLESGEIERALPRLEEVLRFEPRFGNARLDAIRGHALLGHYERVVALLDAAKSHTELANNEIVIRLRFSLWSPIVAASMGSFQTPKDGPLEGPWVIADLMAKIARGKPREADLAAVETLTSIPNVSVRFRQLVNQLVAECFAHSGDHENGVKHLQRAVDLGLFDLGWMDRCPPLEPLRADPRFHSARATVAERALKVVDALGL